MATYWIEPDLNTIEMYELTALSNTGLLKQVCEDYFEGLDMQKFEYYMEHNITVYTTVDDMLVIYQYISRKA